MKRVLIDRHEFHMTKRRNYKHMKTTKWILIMSLLIFTSIITSCASVKPYQQQHLNDEDMQLITIKLSIFEDNFQAYREGATGATGGKVGGGCGCN